MIYKQIDILIVLKRIIFTHLGGYEGRKELSMGKYYVNFSCGHSEEKELFGKMDRRYRRIEYWESYGICSKCYYEKKEIEKSLNCEEVEMFYGDYVTNYKKYNTKAGSYNGSTKTIIVYVPKNE